MTQRRWTALVGVLVAGLGLAVVCLVPVPFVVLTPGAAVDVAGRGPDGDPVVTLSGSWGDRSAGAVGHRPPIWAVWASSGVVDGTPSLLEAMARHVDGSSAVRQADTLYLESGGSIDVRANWRAERSDSDDAARTVALMAAGVAPAPSQRITAVSPAGPSAGLLRVGDVILRVNGVDPQEGDLTRVVRTSPVGSRIHVTVRRGGRSVDVAVRTTVGPDSEWVPTIGVTTQSWAPPPTSVVSRLPDDAADQAGLAVGLAVTERLTPAHPHVAPTRVAAIGRVTEGGEVLSVVGVQQARRSAARAGAEVMIVPQSNCLDVPPAPGPRIVPVGSFTAAVQVLGEIRRGETDALPRCPASGEVGLR